ncbi:hypothetical protein PUNSTDRAFT_137574 [Punctularia strigosozonata HHB-11173 SS5]|uniref:uncharacterized protein n=1 Tax=Punctularia strigosozonata (strain HHB-11173) TaxID=741275 RepID=UPI0004417253|nr:uncharacterized protein PUNSTDRAFT_137574 [Punctularia strigosozonata HHB-11173 SS5]EIN05460.1 hypothetical protein PUNSTDRAFT_137574 [Punctularia strigosozonata HHB-11173 SS5]
MGFILSFQGSQKLFIKLPAPTLAKSDPIELSSDRDSSSSDEDHQHHEDVLVQREEEEEEEEEEKEEEEGDPFSESPFNWDLEETGGATPWPNSELEVPTTPIAARRTSTTLGRGKQPPVLRGDDVEEQAFNVYYEIVVPASSGTRVRGRSQNPKEKETIHHDGPAEIPMDFSWEAFLARTADTIEGVGSVDQLPISSFMWRFVRLKNAPFLPLSKPEGYRAMLAQFDGKKPSQCNIFVRMAKPKRDKPDTPTWAAKADDSSSPSDEGDADLDWKSILSRGRKDEPIEHYAQRILEIWHIGKCKEHPKIPCFFGHESQLHFDLKEPARLAWAAQIVQGEASIVCPKIPSATFNVRTALKKSAVSAAPEPSTSMQPSTPTPGQPYMFPSFAPSFPFMPMPFPYSPGFAPHSSYPSGSRFVTPQLRNKRSFDDRESSPVMDPVSLEEFCTEYRLSSTIRDRLERMEFQPGMSLAQITEDDWKEKGFEKLGWGSVVRANMKYKEKANST